VPQPSRARRLRAAGVLLLATCLVAVVLPPTPASAEPLQYRPPVPGAIVSPFDLPAQAWQPGNRGIDYAPPPGTPVTASADGEVVFAGSVAGRLHVTVRHADGLRTSYSFLAEITVAKGARVRAGEPVGVAGGPIHFGVRAPDGTYLDPAALLAGLLHGRPVLVPGSGEGVDPLVERRHFLEVVASTGFAAVTSVAGEVVDVATSGYRAAAATVDAFRDVVDLAGDEAAAIIRELLGDCTSADEPQPRLTERHIVVVVSGLGTGSGGNSAWELPVEDLGYAPEDVVRFSYAGGRAPSPGAEFREGDPGLAGIAQSEFTGADSQQDLTVSAAALGELLEEVARRAPGVPIDVIAHSQGGVVSRVAIDRAGAEGQLPEEVQNLVTLGSPHAGAFLADGVIALQEHDLGVETLEKLESVPAFEGLDPNSAAIPQLGTSSAVVGSVHDRPLPEGVRFTSIGARWDITVPAGRTRDDAARHVIVDTTVDGPPKGSPEDDSSSFLKEMFDAHGSITRSSEGVREVALAVTRKPPSCQGVVNRLGDLAGSAAVGGVERAIRDGLEVSAPLVDRYGPQGEDASLAVSVAGEAGKDVLD
jgi:hypothetical protein